MEIGREKLLELYRVMVIIREFERRALAEVTSRRVFGGMHLSIGQEAVAAGISANLTDYDYVASTHRGHGHCIAKGVDVKPMMAELLGRIGGTNKGKGGSQHVADMRKGMLGANAIVAGSVPLAVGAALKAKLKGEDSISVAYFGDGAANQGVVHESMNLASIWKLPVLFVCENNGYAQSTPFEYATSVDDIAKRASAYSMPGIVVDGMDVFAVYEETAQLIKRSRAGEGPALLECKTYRFYGHYTGDDTRKYRLPEEEERWRKKDPIELFREHVLGEESLVEGDLDEIQAEVMALIEEAVTYADQSPMPPVEELLTDVYVNYPMRELYRGTGLPIVGPVIDTTQVESSPHHGGKR